MSDQEIKVQVTLNVKDAVDRAREIQKNIDELKNKLKSMVAEAKTSGASLGYVTSQLKVQMLAMQREVADSLKVAVPKFKTQMLPDETTGKLKKQKIQVGEEMVLDKEGREALSRYKQEASLAYDEIVKLAKANVLLQKSVTPMATDIDAASARFQKLGVTIATVRAEVEKVAGKTGIANLGSNVKQSAQLQQSMVESYSQQRYATLKPNLETGQYDQSELLAAKADIVAYGKLVSQSLGQIRKEWVDHHKAVVNAQQEATRIKLAGQAGAIKAEIDLIRSSTKQKIDAAKQEFSTITDPKQAAPIRDDYIKKASDAYKEYRTSIENVRLAQEKAALTGTKTSQQEVVAAQQVMAVAKAKSDSYTAVANTAEKEFKRIENAQKKVGDTTEAVKGVGRLESAITTLGNTAKYVFGAVFGLTVVGALRSFFGFVGQATDQAVALERSFYLFEIGIRALQKIGFDTTIASWYTAMDEFKKRFPIFSTQEVVGGFSVAILKLRQYGATQAEINDLLEISGTLAVAYGRDFEEMAGAVTGAITRGYFESLQSMGIAIGRINIMQAAQEQALGGFTQLTEQQRFKLGYKILKDNVEVLVDDMGRLGEEGEAAFIKIKAAQSAATNAAAEFGKAWIGVKIAFLETKAAILGGLAEIPTTVETIFTRMDLTIQKSILKFNLLGKSIAYVLANIKGEVISSEVALQDAGRISKELDEVNKQLTTVNMKQAYSQLANEKRPDYAKLLESSITNIQMPEWTKILGKEGVEKVLREIANSDAKYKQLLSDYTGPTNSAEDYANTLAEVNRVLKQAAPNLEDDIQQYLDDRDEAVKESADNIIEIEKDLSAKLKDLEVDWAKDLADAKADYLKGIADAYADYAKRIADAQQNYTQGVADAGRDYRQNELDAERQYQKDMRRLREDFLMDLEGALRERNALQVIQLSRQYELDKRRRTEDFQDDKDQRKREYKERLRELKEQLDKELSEAARAYAERMTMLYQERQDRITALNEQYKLEREEAAKNAEQKKIEEDARHKEELDRMDKEFGEKLEKVGKQLEEAGLVTSEQLTKMRNDILAETSPTSALYQFWDVFGLKLAEGASAVATTAANVMTNLGSMIAMLLYFNMLSGAGTKWNYQKTWKPEGPPIPGAAEGGQFIATKPTMITVGEGGEREFVSIIPFSKMGTADSMAKVPSTGMPTSLSRASLGGGNATIQILLSPDLEGRITTNTLDSVAEVLMGVVRSK